MISWSGFRANESGNRSDALVRNTVFMSDLARKTGMSSNSAIVCLHEPHGVAKGTSLWSATTAIALNFLFPAETAQAMAAFSAHVETGYEAFSMLQPLKMLPSSQRIAEPTLNLLYGEYENSRTVAPSRINFWMSGSRAVKSIVSKLLIPATDERLLSLSRYGRDELAIFNRVKILRLVTTKESAILIPGKTALILT